MRTKVVLLVLALLMVTAFGSFKFGSFITVFQERSAVASPIRAMLQNIHDDMKHGDHSKAQRKLERLINATDAFLGDRGPTPERFYHEILTIQ
jgi:hypothetical protein